MIYIPRRRIITSTGRKTQSRAQRAAEGGSPLTVFYDLCFPAVGGGDIYSFEPLPPMNGRAGGGLMFFCATI